MIDPTRIEVTERSSTDPVPDTETETETETTVAGSVALLQTVADPVRWTVLQQLAERPACVCKLQEHVPVPANLLSYHLKVLRKAQLVTTSRRGRWIDYALAEDALVRLHAALPGGLTSGRTRP